MSDLLETPSENTADDRLWYCVHAKSKREHLAVAALEKIVGIEAFTPRIEYIKSTRRGKVNWKEALFPGYLFVKCNHSEHARAIRYSQNVLRIIEFGRHAIPVPEKLIADLKSHSPDNKPISFIPDVNIGDSIEIGSGPLQGLEGKVLEMPSGEERVKVLIEMLGKNQVVDVDLYSLLFGMKPQ